MMNNTRLDPIVGAAFWIEIQGVVVAQFAECTGLRVEIEGEQPYHEGGRNDTKLFFPRVAKYSNISLRRGWTTSTELWTWCEGTLTGRIEPRDCSIVMCRLNDGGDRNEIARINVFQAYPVKWSGPDFKVDGATVGFESIELTHMGFRLART